MLERLLVPLDGSPMAEAVLPAAAFIARASGAQVQLIHAIEKNAPGTVHEEPHLRDTRHAEQYLRDAAMRFLHSTENCEFHVHTVEVDSVVSSIIEHALEFRSDLVLLCTHGQGGMRRWVAGSIAQQVAGRGPLPVFIMHAEKKRKPAEFRCKNILVPIDGQPDHEHGLAFAKEMAALCEATIHLVLVVPTYGTISGRWAVVGRLLPGSTAQILDEEEDARREYLARTSNALKGEGLRVTAYIKRGDPARVIDQFARESHADIIVLGTHGKSGFDAIMSSSVAARICKKCRVPLVMVPVGKPMIGDQ